MTEDECRELAREIVKQGNNILIKFGKTNGKHCLHLQNEGQSNTIYSGVEWDQHRWNSFNRPKKKKKEN